MTYSEIPKLARLWYSLLPNSMQSNWATATVRLTTRMKVLMYSWQATSEFFKVDVIYGRVGGISFAGREKIISGVRNRDQQS